MTKKVKKFLPDLRFPEFQQLWDESAIGKFLQAFSERSSVQDQYEVLTSSRDGLIKQKDYYDNNRITDRDNVGFNIIPPGYITYRSRSDDRKFFFNINELKMTGIISSYYPVFKIENGSNKFFSYLFLKNYHTLGKYSVGTSQTVLSFNELRKIKLAVPSLHEQKKIAAFLSVVDDKLTHLRRKRELLKNYKWAVMQQLFSQQIRFKQDDGSDFPDWQKQGLGKLFSERSEKGFQDCELLSVKMNGGVIKRSEVDGKNNASDDRSNYKRVLPGDIAYNSMRMWQGASGLSDIKGIVSPAYTVVTPKKNSDSLFFAYLFKYEPLVFMFRRFSQGLTSDTWNLKYPAFSKIQWFVPTDKSEQQKIANFLQSVDNKIDAVAEQITQLDTFKKGLLQKLFV